MHSERKLNLIRKTTWHFFLQFRSLPINVNAIRYWARSIQSELKFRGISPLGTSIEIGLFLTARWRESLLQKGDPWCVEETVYWHPPQVLRLSLNLRAIPPSHWIRFPSHRRGQGLTKHVSTSTFLHWFSNSSSDFTFSAAKLWRSCPSVTKSMKPRRNGVYRILGNSTRLLHVEWTLLYRNIFMKCQVRISVFDV